MTVYELTKVHNDFCFTGPAQNLLNIYILQLNVFCYKYLYIYIASNMILVYEINQIIYSNAPLNPLRGIFSDKLLIIVGILRFQFAEVFNSKEM